MYDGGGGGVVWDNRYFSSQKSIFIGTLRVIGTVHKGFLIVSAAEGGRENFEGLRLKNIIFAIQIDKISLQNLKIFACGALAFSLDYFRSLYWRAKKKRLAELEDHYFQFESLLK